MPFDDPIFPSTTLRGRAGTFEVVVGVDPLLGGTHRMTSDAFFAANTEHFDLIFIDGLHQVPPPPCHPSCTSRPPCESAIHVLPNARAWCLQAHQLARDIDNALAVLAPGGTIVLHDCHPSHRLYATFPRDPVDADIYWNGDSYR